MTHQESYTGQGLINMGCTESPELGAILRIVNSKPHTRDEVMAGDGNRDAPWRKKRKERSQQKKAGQREKHQRTGM